MRLYLINNGANGVWYDKAIMTKNKGRLPLINKTEKALTMKKLIAKIRAILRNRRVRKIWTRTVSSIACLVVFITTYALVLPAITMESEVACGIEAHQHDESCYEERLICNIPESDGHKHTADCYSTTQKLICDRSEHLHTSNCYDEEGNLTCSQEEHQHGEECYEEIQELICGLEESEGHHHDSSCYEKVLTCEKEVHTHSPACYREDAASVAATEHSAIATTTTTSADDAAMDETANASGTFDPAETAAEGYVPTLDELDFRQLLNDYTTIYYHRPEDSTEDSGQITDWQKVDEDTVLGETDILRVYLAYTIPAGSLNETNATARYRLPGNLHLTDEQMEAINQMENGLSGLYVDYDTLQITDTEKHSGYLGVEAVDGLRTPDQTIEDYLSDNNDTGDGEQTAQEIISAVVKADQVYDEDGVYGKKGAYLGTDLVFTFSPYTILKNRNEYDSEGTPVKAGESVSGWFALDFNMDQVDWDGNAAEITFVSEDNDLNTGLVSVVLKKADPTSEETPQETDPSSEESPDSNNSDDEKTFNENSSAEENKAETVEETHPAVSFEDSLTVHTGNLSSDTDAGNLPNSSKMTVSVSAEAGTFPAGTTMVLSAVTDMDAVAEAVEGTVDSKTCGFQAVDISFWDKDGNEIEPLKPISVTMRSDSIKAATEDSSMAPVVVHVEDQSKKPTDAASDLVTVLETLPSSVNNDDDDSESHGITDPSETISFKADSFSIYAIVYTVDFHYEVNGRRYDFSIPGGGFVSLEHVVELLGVADSDTYSENDAESAENQAENTPRDVAEGDIRINTAYSASDLNEMEISEKTRKFVADVERVEFSSPELVWVGKVDEDSTIGGLKKANGLTCEYSADLTAEQIGELDAQTVEAGDWALISMQPFDTEESLTVTMKNGDRWTVTVTDAQQIRGATVHYGYMNGNTFVEFTPDQFTPPTSGFGNPAYLIYDVQGYQYAGTTYYSNYTLTDMRYASETQPVINGTSSGHYYVTYEPRPAATDGGHYVKDETYPEGPTVTKNSVENPNTGTNTISLEVEGKRRTDKPKADIIVIYDVSGSMQFPIWFDSTKDVPTGADATNYFVGRDHLDTDPRPVIPGNNPRDGKPDQRDRVVKDALASLANDFMGDQSATDPDPAIRMGLVSFSTGADTVLDLTGVASQFDNAVSNLTLGGGTNWEAALQLANSIEVRQNADTYVMFITDGNPTFRISRLNETDAQLKSNGGKSGITEGYYGPYGIFGTGNVDEDKTSTLSINNNNQAALHAAQAIVGKDKVLFGIGISNEVGGMQSLITKSGSTGTSVVATDSQSLTTAIDAIKAQIQEKTFGYSDVQITDGITALTQTVQKSGLVNLPEDDDFEYFKGHEATQADVDAGHAANVGDVIWEPWTAEQMAEEHAGRATYEDGAVKWNLGEQFMLEEGVHYKVDFTVWPSQEAYDILADLNNGYVRETSGALTRYGADSDTPEAAADKAYEHLPQDVKDQITKSGGKYILKTNEDDAGYSYKKATKEGTNGEVTTNGNAIEGTFDPVIPLNLEKDKLNVEKDWQASPIDSQGPEPVAMEVRGGSKLFKELTMTPVTSKEGSTVPNSGKSGDIYISCGLLKVDKSSGKVVVYETGRDFSLREVGEASRHWDLESDTMHPMVINNRETMLILVEGEDVPAAMKNNTELAYCTSGGAEYYRIENKVYKDAGGTVDLYGLNTRRSSLDLVKEVLVDGEVTSDTVDTKFTYKIRIDVDPTILDWDHDLEQYVAISVRGDETPSQMKADAQYQTTAYLPSECGYKDADYQGYLMAKSGEEFYLSIKNGWSIRFMNLPVGTTYSIEEVLPADSLYNFAGGRFEVVKEKDGQPTVTQFKRKKLTGTITETATLYKAVYQNTTDEVPPKGALKITKAVTVDGNTPTDENKSFTDGTFTFEVKGVDGTETEGITRQIKITFENGNAVSYQIDDEDIVLVSNAEGNGHDVVLDDLEPGQYTVEETGTGTLELKAVHVTEGDGNSVTDNVAAVTVGEGEENTVQISFTNDAETTNLTAQKTWSDGAGRHSSDTVTYHLYRVPYVGTTEYPAVEITTAAGFTGQLSAGNSWTETITGLPKAGMYTLAGGDPMAVSYRYYVTEDLFGTYTPVIRETPEGSGNWIINNVARDENDRFTSVDVSKLWKENADAQPTTEGHNDDNITVKLTQHAKLVNDGTAGKVTVTLNLIDADDTTHTETQQVNKGEITLRVSRPEGNIPNQTVTINSEECYPRADGDNNTVYYDYTVTVDSDTTITARLNYYETRGFIFSRTYYDRRASGSNTNTIWDYTLIDTAKPIDDIISETLANTDPPVATQEYTYTLTKDSLAGGAGVYPAVSTGDWAGVIGKSSASGVDSLPLYKKIDDSTYYVYTYTVDEIMINGEPIDGSQYTKEVTQDTNGRWIVTNTRKPGINLTVRKVAKADVSNMSADTLPGATFVLEKYTASDYQSKDLTWTEQTAVDSDNATSGVFSFANLSEGYYQLVEEVCPTGYVRTTSNPRFHVKPEGSALKVYIINTRGEEVETTDLLKVENTTINVGNEPGAALPNTGGPGTRIFTILGSILILGTGVLLWRRGRFI